MVSGYLVTFSASLRRPLHDVHARAVVALHVEVAGCESGRLAVVEVSRDRQRLEKNLRHYHGAAEVENDTPVLQRRKRCGETAEIPVAGVADRGAIGGWMLMNYLGAQRRVHGAGDAEAMRGQNH